MFVNDRNTYHNKQHINKPADFIDIRAYKLFIEV
jgi:hypothetical protein